GVKFGDAELVGIPRVLVIGRGAADGQVELWDRRSGERDALSLNDAIERLTS
ncbi:His/Gly/Thr/Pro-type tRNA ligase C-terminal domain-containing protein, partial [Microbacterium sp.]|uniref:His/Gly/Thr/Pro-type tRNA ligase C-terminal domain-containing protein n=1 Tax=Microbacterium sp. TaxID=51671 RepID=UPI002736EA33